MSRPDGRQSYFRSEVLRFIGATLDEEKVSLLVSKMMAKSLLNDLVAKGTFDFKQLSNVPVIVGDDVGTYVASLPKGTQNR